MNLCYEDDQDTPNEDVLDCDYVEELERKLWLTQLFDDEESYQYFLPKTRLLVERRNRERIAAINNRIAAINNRIAQLENT